MEDLGTGEDNFTIEHGYTDDLAAEYDLGEEAAVDPGVLATVAPKRVVGLDVTRGMAVDTEAVVSSTEMSSSATNPTTPKKKRPYAGRSATLTDLMIVLQVEKIEQILVINTKASTVVFKLELE